MPLLSWEHLSENTVKATFPFESESLEKFRTLQQNSILFRGMTKKIQAILGKLPLKELERLLHSEIEVSTDITAFANSKLSGTTSDVLTLLHNIFWNRAVVVEGKNSPIDLSSFLDQGWTKIFIAVPENMETEFSLTIPDTVQPRNLPSFTSFEFFIGRGASVILSSLQNRALFDAGIISIRVFLQDNSQFNHFSAIVGSSWALHSQEIFFEGNGASARQKILFAGGEKQSFEIYSTHIHRGEAGTSEMTGRGILKSDAYARFDGNIKIAQTGKKTDAKLNSHVLLLSDTAKCDAIPQLEIGTHDVRAMHSASMTRVDENQLFYASSRGIEEREATELIARGFLESLYQDLPVNSMKEMLDSLISQKVSLHV